MEPMEPHLDPPLLFQAGLCERAILQDMCISGGQESTKPSRPLLLLLSSCENAIKAGSSLKPLKLVRFKHLYSVPHYKTGFLIFGHLIDYLQNHDISTHNTSK